MKKFFYVVCIILLANERQAVLLAVEVAALDFTNGGSAWTVTELDNGLPLVFEKDGDPTKVGFAHESTFPPVEEQGTGNYHLMQEVFAPTGFTMSNIVVEAAGSGFSSWLMNSYVGFGLSDQMYPEEIEVEDNSFNFLPDTYAWSADNWGNVLGDNNYNGNNGTVVVDFPMVNNGIPGEDYLDATGDADFSGLTSVWVGVKLLKGLAHVSQQVDISQIKLYADLTEVVNSPGDFDGDLDVDGNDFLLWQRGQSPTSLSPTELMAWQDNYGDSTPLTANVGSVPEPASLTILALAGLLIGTRCCR
ncbi:hypothetical protein [Bythopirellula goksoeyrii]|uniref:PEP-CTERM protein-sorting domain-containing protein n=1 Tax=Bythopirellula goksoeyrii TaxID=1400387 RepID=A0A5B9Q6S3_9BACT|nr:hypothetical protein [Bythopirellula goksoeyrii]QEG33419.1 hypothetical protein Pr1d_06820 [Bythopirellula goksoeyrii]